MSIVAPLAWAQDAHLQDGLALIRQGNYAAALPEFEQAARAHPQNPAIENALGIIESRLGRARLANEHYKKAILLSPGFEEAHKNLGYNYLAGKDYQLAEQELKTAIALDPGDSFAHYYLARTYLATGLDQSACEQLGPSTQLLRNDAQGTLQMAEACLRLNQTRAAAPLIERLLKNPALPPREEYQLALLLFERRQYAPAVAIFRRMAAAQPAWINQYNLAIGLLRTGQSAEAASLLASLSAARPRDAQILSLLGTSEEAAGKPAQALEAYGQAIQADPANPDRYLDFTRLLMSAGRYQASERLVADGLARAPDSYALEIRMGSIQMMQGRYDEARASFQKAIQRDPAVPLGYVALAQAYARLGKNQRATETLAAAQKKLPDQFVLDYFYGQSLLRAGKSGEAEQVLRRAVALKPDVPEGHLLLGRAYLEGHQLDSALAEFDETLRLSPRDANARIELARIYAQRGETGKAREMAASAAEIKQKRYDSALKAQNALLDAARSQAPAQTRSQSWEPGKKKRP